MDNDECKKIKIGIVGKEKLSILLITKLLNTDFEINLLDSIEEQSLEYLSVRYHSSIPSLVRRCSIVFTILSDEPELEETLFGEYGIINYVSGGNVIVDMSSVSPEFIKEISEQLLEKEISFLDATIINEEPPESGLIQMILIGGDDHVYKSVLPVIRSLADEVRHIGENGASQFYRQAFGVRPKRN